MPTGVSNTSQPAKGRLPLAWLGALTVSALLVMVAISLIRPMTTYKLLVLDAGGVTVGIVSAAYALLPLIFIFTVGSRAQRARSLKPLLIVGALTIAAGSGIIAAAQSLILVVVGTIVVGFGQMVFAIAGQAMIARFASNRQLDMAFGWFTAGFSAGQMFGPLIGGALLSGAEAGDPAAVSQAIDLALGLGAVSAALVLLVLLAARRSFRASAGSRHTDATQPTKSVEQAERPTIRQIFRIPRVKSYVFSSVALLAMVDILMAFLPLVGEAAGVPPFWVGVFLAVRAGASILSRAVLSLMRRIASREVLVLLALWVPGLSLAVLPATIHILWLALMIMVISGFFLGVGQPLTMSQVTQAVPSDWRSAALAVRLMGNRVGQVGVPLGAGTLVGLWGPGAAVWLACLMLVSSGAEQLVTFRRKS